MGLWVLQVLWLLPTVQKRACDFNWYLKGWMILRLLTSVQVLAVAGLLL